MQQNNKEDRAKSSKISYNRIFTTRILPIVGLLLVLLTISYSNYWQKTVQITEIKIQGNKYIPAAEIQNNIYKFILAREIKDINFEFIEQLILANKFIKSVNFVSQIPGQLIINLEVKNILCKAIKSPNEEFYFTEDGELLPITNYKLGFNLPTIDLDRSNSININDLQTLASFMKHYYVNNHNDFNARYVWINSNGINLKIANNIVVKIGLLDEIDNKLHKLSVFLKEMAKSQIDIYQYIDLRWSNQIVVF